MTDAELSREEWIEERAGILTFDGGIPDNMALLCAIKMWMEQHPDAAAATGKM